MNFLLDLKGERKKLRADKMDLLAHVKQLCASLQDKEQELRDFIRNYEHRILETESSNVKVSSDRERERWTLLKHARDESERSLALAAQLNARDIQLQRIQEQLQEVTKYCISIALLIIFNIISRLADNYLAVCPIRKVYYHLHH